MGFVSTIIGRRRTGAVARRHHPGRHPPALFPHRARGSPPGMRKAMPGSPTKWRRAPSPNIPTRPMPSTTRCRRRSSPACSVRTANIPRCFYKEPASTLQEAEEEALRQTVEHADLADGQSILELGCGWGSLSLWMARQFPHSQISAVSNSNSQREYIEGEAARRGLANLRVITQDMNVFAPDAQFDRIVSVEMFEHMMNWRELMTRVRVMAEARWPLLPAHLHPSLRRLSVRSRRWRGLDRATFLYRRRDAEPSSDPAICRSVRGRKGMALERHALSAHRAGLARQFRLRIATRSSACCARSMAARPRCGCGAGAGSSSPPQACSATPMAASGASAITG